MELTEILEMVLIGSLGIIGYFLRGIYIDIKVMAQTMQSMNERLIRHEERNAQLEHRIERVEERIEKQEHDIRQLLITSKN
jgi:hypothetical protein